MRRVRVSHRTSPMVRTSACLRHDGAGGCSTANSEKPCCDRFSEISAGQSSTPHAVGIPPLPDQPRSLYPLSRFSVLSLVSRRTTNFANHDAFCGGGNQFVLLVLLRRQLLSLPPVIFKNLQWLERLARAGSKLAVIHGPYFAAQRLLAHRNANFFPKQLTQVARRQRTMPSR